MLGSTKPSELLIPTVFQGKGKFHGGRVHRNPVEGSTASRNVRFRGPFGRRLPCFMKSASASAIANRMVFGGVFLSLPLSSPYPIHFVPETCVGVGDERWERGFKRKGDDSISWRTTPSYSFLVSPVTLESVVDLVTIYDSVTNQNSQF